MRVYCQLTLTSLLLIQTAAEEFSSNAFITDHQHTISADGRYLARKLNMFVGMSNEIPNEQPATNQSLIVENNQTASDQAQLQVEAKIEQHVKGSQSQTGATENQQSDQLSHEKTNQTQTEVQHQADEEVAASQFQTGAIETQPNQAPNEQTDQVDGISSQFEGGSTESPAGEPSQQQAGQTQDGAKTSTLQTAETENLSHQLAGTDVQGGNSMSDSQNSTDDQADSSSPGQGALLSGLIDAWSALAKVWISIKSIDSWSALAKVSISVCAAGAIFLATAMICKQ